MLLGTPSYVGKARLVVLAFLAPICLCAIGLRPAYGGGEEAAAIEQRLAATDRYLASDECEGRGLGTKGIDLAADYIADQLRQLNRYGVKTDLWDGGPFQKFKVAVDAESGPEQSSGPGRSAQGQGRQAAEDRAGPGQGLHPLGDQRERQVRPALGLRRLRDHGPQGQLRRLCRR